MVSGHVDPDASPAALFGAELRYYRTVAGMTQDEPRRRPPCRIPRWQPTGHPSRRRPGSQRRLRGHRDAVSGQDILKRHPGHYGPEGHRRGPALAQQREVLLERAHVRAELVSRAGAAAVSAVDPSESFAAAVRERLPGVDVRLSSAEQLPFADGDFDAALAQLVVHFMTDPVAGLREMGRVTCPGGMVAACVWDHGGGRGPLSVFWRAVRELDPGARDESDLAGVRDGQLASLCAQAGLGGIRAGELTVQVRQASFEQWWEPFTLGVGPAGTYVASLDPPQRGALREQCRRLLPAGPVEVIATSWAVTCHP